MSFQTWFKNFLNLILSIKSGVLCKNALFALNKKKKLLIFWAKTFWVCLNCAVFMIFMGLRHFLAFFCCWFSWLFLLVFTCFCGVFKKISPPFQALFKHSNWNFYDCFVYKKEISKPSFPFLLFFFFFLYLTTTSFFYCHFFF